MKTIGITISLKQDDGDPYQWGEWVHLTDNQLDEKDYESLAQEMDDIFRQLKDMLFKHMRGSPFLTTGEKSDD